jgi:Sulfotransferase family
MFVLRDPVARFVSAFNSRLRMGRPRYDYPWCDEEKVAFANFATADELATALGSRRRSQAEHAMHSIGHLNTPYRYWFRDEKSFRARLPDLFFIGLTERLGDEFELLKRKLGLPQRASLPRDATTAHWTPAGYADGLSEVARTNLELWYEWDVPFYRSCRELAPRVNSAVPTERRREAVG